MADLKLVGAVAIKVRPDASGFREDANKQIKKEARDLQADVELDAKLDAKEAKKDADKLEKELEGRSFTWNVKLDHDSVRAAQKQLDSMMEPTEEIKFKLGDQDSIDEAIAKLQEMADAAEVKITYAQDQKGYESVLAKIEQIRRQKIETTIHFGTDDAELDELEADMLERIAELSGPVEIEVEVRETHTITYNEDRAGYEAAIKSINDELRKIDAVTLSIDKEGISGYMNMLVEMEKMQDRLAKEPLRMNFTRDQKGLEKIIAQIDAELDKIRMVEIETHLNPLNLAFTRAQMEAELGKQTVEIEYEEGDLSSLKAARNRIMALLPMEHKLHIKTELNEADLLANLAKLDAMITAATPVVKPKVEPKVSTPDYLKAVAQIGALAKSQTVDIFVKVNNAGLLLAAAKLTGLRAASRWTEGFARSLGSLDRNLPIVAAAVVGINTLTSGFISMTASAFSLGNELGTVVRSMALLAPAMILGYAAVRTVMQGVFKDFGAAVNGDEKAIEKLTESGKKAAANMRVIFQDIRETVSKNFWAEASDNMLRFTEVALPAVRDGMTKLSTSMGGVFGSIVDSTSKFAEEDGFLVFFTNLIRGMDKIKDGMGPFMSGFLNLASLGSTVFPRLGAAFDTMSQKFDAWVNGLIMDGSFSRWVDMGIQGIKDLWSAGSSLVGVWNNIGQAAQGAGALTLSSFSRAMARLEEVTSGYRFQTNLSRIFKGAREASDEFHTSLGKLGPAMDNFSITTSNALANSGKALGAFIGLLGDVLSSSNLDKGMTSFLSGVKVMFEELRPAAAPITEILRTFGEILGTVARDSGPLFRTLFQQLATVLTTAWHALEPFLPALIQVGTTILDVLGPAMATAANELIPAFAAGLLDLGDGLVPVIKFLADFAVGVAGMISDTPLPVIAGLVAGVLALTGAFSFASTVLPIVGAAMEVFGVQAALTGARLQLMIPVVGIVLAALTGLAIGGVAALATSQKSGTPYANEYATALREDAKAAGEFGNAIGAATTKMAIQKLQQDGAYDAAKKLGISTWDLTQAVLHGGKAWDDIQDKISGANRVYDENFDAATKANKGATTYGGTVKSKVTPEMLAMKNEANKLNGILGNHKGSLDAASAGNLELAEAYKAAGIEGEGTAKSTDILTEALEKQKSRIGEAASATGVLTDAFASSASKVDAMRKTFDILIGKDAKQSAAETLGAYTKGFNDLKETVSPLAQNMRDLGDAAYGENGFLNVAGGNKAVLQVNQALVDEVNNVWAGAKAAYDAAIKQGKTAQGAFEESQKFIADHKGDYDALAEASGLSAEKVQGQWDAVFGHEWVLRVSLSGATEAATRAQEMVTALKGSFDGQKFTAWLDANPEMALLAIEDPMAAANAFVNTEWKAQLDALPGPAQDALRELTGMTEAEWNRGDFKSVLRVAQGVPGLSDAILAIRNGAQEDYMAIIWAAVNNVSLEEAKRAIAAAAAPRDAWITIKYLDSGNPVKGGGQVWVDPMNSANGNILKFRNDIAYKAFANGGIERHVAQIARPGVTPRVWAEKETYGEAYIPYAQSKRPRSLAILSQVAKDFGYELSKASEGFANGGFAGHAGPSTTTSANVSIGNLYTVDADEAVRKIRNSQADALAVAGITLNGA